MLLTLKFEVKIPEITGILEVKNYQISDDFSETMEIGMIVKSATERIEAKFKESSDNVEIRLLSIIPEVNKAEKTIVEEPVTVESDAFDGAMNPPVENVVTEEAPEGFVPTEEVETSPFTNTYYDNEAAQAQVEEPKTDVKSYNDDEMFEKFLKLSFLTRQNLLIKDFNLLPEEHRGDRHKVAFPIAVQVAKEKNVIDKLYEAIDTAFANTKS